jgi:hypothetical protein
MQVISKIKDINFDLNSFSIGEKLKLGLIVGSSTLLGFFTFLTLKIYFNHRKYSHIPGPPNRNGYLKNLLRYYTNNYL